MYIIFNLNFRVVLKLMHILLKWGVHKLYHFFFVQIEHFVCAGHSKICIKLVMKVVFLDEQFVNKINGKYFFTIVWLFGHE